ncbi:MAG TPA: GrpB family protein [Trueperaceae bacterium]|nr:GrpB family protein [Trueperaceae bacterium]
MTLHELTDPRRVPVVLEPYNVAWPLEFQAESAKITDALGHMVDGGVLDGLEHMGSTSVPGLLAKPTIDIMGRVHPYPPSSETVRSLEALGFTFHGEYGLPGRAYFTKGPHDVHLHLVSFESDHWERHLVLRDYLRSNASARERYAALKTGLAARFRDDRPAYQEGKTELITSLDTEAAAWHVNETGFAPIERLAVVLAGMPDDGSWAVSSGWALDLHLGRPTRYHDDLDVEVDVSRQADVQQVLHDGGWRLDQVVDDGRYRPWPRGELLLPGTHQVHARKDGEVVDLLFAPRTPSDWVYRRDPRVSLPLRHAVRRATLPTGKFIPYLAPEAVLLFKSRSSGGGGGDGGPRAKDSADFDRVLPTLDDGARAWLTGALRTVHDTHEWLEALGRPSRL